MFVNSSTKQKKLVDALVDMGKITAPEVQVWQNLSDKEAENELLKKGISPEDIAKAYSRVFSLPFVSLEDIQISPEALEAIPEDLAQEYKIIAYEYNFTHKIIKVAVAEPSKLSSQLEKVITDLKGKKGIGVELAVTTPADFQMALSQYTVLASSSKQEQGKVAPVAVSASVPITTGTDKNQIPMIDLSSVQIPHEVISKFPEDIARKYKMVVFDSPHPSFIKVAVAEPQDKKVREILDFIREKNDIAIEEFQATPGQIHQSFKYYQPIEVKPKEKPSLPPAAPALSPPPLPPQEIKELSPKRFVPRPAFEKESEPLAQKPAAPLSESEEEVPAVQTSRAALQPSVAAQENDLDTFLGQEIKEVGDLQAIAETGNVPKIVAAAIALATRQKASDIHIEPEGKFSRVRFRVDGILRDIIKLPLDLQSAIISRIKILSKLKIDESRIPQDGRFDAQTSGHQIDLRISTLPTIHGEKAAMRILDKSLKMYTLEELGLVGRSLKIVIDNIDKPYGIVLSTGPTGSGKSTTLYAILSRISTASVNIVTLEDPVEYELPGLNQCQIRPKIGFTFANGLRSILRQDPNIIMVGEIRDAETASLATHAALTGHLVLSSLHTNDATGALPRLINMGVEPFLITSSVNCLIGQRLVRRLCDKCKRPAHIPGPVAKEIEEELQHLNFPKPYKFFEGRGCPECSQGYRGRIGIFEVLPMSEKIENLAISRRPASEIKAAAISEGMITMKQDGLIKALKGITSINEVLRVVTI